MSQSLKMNTYADAVYPHSKLHRNTVKSLNLSASLDAIFVAFLISKVVCTIYDAFKENEMYIEFLQAILNHNISEHNL